MASMWTVRHRDGSTTTAPRTGKGVHRLSSFFPFSFLLASLLALSLVVPTSTGASLVQQSVPSDPGNVFTVQNYSGNQTFPLSVDSQHLPPEYLYYTAIFPSAATGLYVMEGASVRLSRAYQPEQSGSIDQIPVDHVAVYSISLNGTGQFAVFLLPQSWQSSRDVRMETLGIWTTIGILSPMWGHGVSTITVSLTTSHALTIYIAEFQDTLGLTQVSSVDNALEFTLTPSASTLFYLVFLQALGSTPASVHLVLGATSSDSSLGIFLEVFTAAAVVATIAWLTARNRTEKRRIASQKTKKRSR